MNINNCPFCGSEEQELVVSGSGFQWISCTDCNVDGPTRVKKTEAIEAWNKPGDRIRDLEAEEGLLTASLNGR